MNVSRSSFLAATLFVGCLAVAPFDCDTIAAQVPLPDNSDTTYPQIVRVSYVEGDVRVTRGKQGEKASGGALWQKAVVDLPLESGFSLVTGAGRLEIEFEDASTVYLGENSVLAFNELSSTRGVPYTELALLSGVLSLNVKPMSPAERFFVRTPTDWYNTRYPNWSFVRVNSYLDAMSVTQLGTTLFRLDPTAAVLTNEGATYTYPVGQRWYRGSPVDPSTYAEWDEWVARRVMDRGKAMETAMQESGLAAPIPGLAEMNAQGTFFDCAPYGRCWEPSSGWQNPEPSQTAQQTPQPADVTRQTVSVAALKQGGAQQTGAQPPPARTPGLVTQIDTFPCSPLQVRKLIAIDPVTGKKRIVSSQVLPMGSMRGNLAGYPYDWAVCHAGAWIPHRGHYAWVVGPRRHHHPPVHWVKEGGKLGFVPVHPRDVAGKPPVNLKAGIFHPVDKHGDTLEKIAYADGDKVKLLGEMPKEFRPGSIPTLERAEEPRAVAHALNDMTKPGEAKVSEVKASGTPIAFDHKSQTFMVATQVVRGAGSRTVVQQIGGRDSGLQAHAGGGSSEMARGGGATGSSGGAGARGSSSSYSGGGGGAASHASAPSSAPSGGGGSAAASSGGGGKH